MSTVRFILCFLLFWTSPNAVFPQAANSCCLFVLLSASSFVFNSRKASSLLDWDQVTDLATEEFLISLPWETLGLFLQIALGQYPFTMWSPVSFTASGWKVHLGFICPMSLFFSELWNVLFESCLKPVVSLGQQTAYSQLSDWFWAWGSSKNGSNY